MLRFLLAGVLLLAACAASSAPRTVPFTGGSVVVDTSGDGEHVLVRDEKDAMVAESECGGSTGSFDQIVAFTTALKAATADGKKLAALFSYPLTVNRGGKPNRIASPEALEKAYDKAFTPQVIAEIAKAEPHHVFCRNGMAMTGRGVVWSRVDKDGVLKGAVINQ